MDNYLSKLKSNLTTTLTTTINSTVGNLNQLNKSMTNFLPGNNVIKEFEITNLDEWTSGGNELCWKIYDAIKKSTNQKVSIFVLEKKSLDIFNKKDRELVLEALKKSVQQLTRLRHPSILKVEYPLEESRDCIAFASEPVVCSLSNLLTLADKRDNNISNSKILENYELIDLEIKYGLYQISEGLSFLHSDCKILHRNICPDNIIITKRGAWKLFGFEFCSQPNSIHENPLTFPTLNVINQTTEFPRLLLPNLVYLPPEYYQDDEEKRKILLTSDMYSLGFLTFNLFNRNEKSHHLFNRSLSINQLNQLRIKEIEMLVSNYNITLKTIPSDSRFQIKNFLNIDQYARPNITQYQQLAIFEDIQVKTLQFLNSIFKWDNMEKVQFYRGLPEILALMPKKVKVNRIMGELAKEMNHCDMVPFVLPNYLLILKEIDNEKEFIEYCLPQLNAVFQMKEPIQISIILLQNIELLLLKCKKNQETIKDYILPMICRCFDQNSLEVKDLCLQSVPNICYLIEQTSIKNSLLPKIKKLCLSSSNVSIKIKCLLCIGKIMKHLDKWTVIDDVISFVPEINSREAGCIMSCIGIYQLSFNQEKLGLTKEILCNKVLPHMLSLSIESSLNINQFEIIMTLFKQMLENMENEHKSKLEQIDNMKSQQEMALVSFNQAESRINSKNILKSIDEMTNQCQLGANTNVLNSSNQTMNLKSTLDTMSQRKKNSQSNFFENLTAELINKPQTTSQITKNGSNTKNQVDYSHLIDLDLSNSNNKPKINKLKKDQDSSNLIQDSIDKTKQLKITNSNNIFNQSLLNESLSNKLQPNFILPQQLSNNTKLIDNQYVKLNKSELEDFLK